MKRPVASQRVASGPLRTGLAQTTMAVDNVGKKWGFLQEPSAEGITELLEMNRNQLRQVTGLHIGHCH